jgi:hypothetical protein
MYIWIEVFTATSNEYFAQGLIKSYTLSLNIDAENSIRKFYTPVIRRTHAENVRLYTAADTSSSNSKYIKYNYNFWKIKAVPIHLGQH